MSASQVNSKVALAVSAQESGDYATALKYLRSAKMLLAGMADVQQGADGLRWDRAAIDSLIKDLERQQTIADAATAAGTTARGIRQVKVTYKRVDDDEEYD